MHDHRRRLERLDWQHIRQLAAEAGRPFGFTADDILEEARRIFALPEAAPRRELHRVYNELTPEEARELDGSRPRAPGDCASSGRVRGGEDAPGKDVSASRREAPG